MNIFLEGDKFCKEESCWNLLSINTNKVLFPTDKFFYSKNQKLNINLNLDKGAYILFLKDKYGDGGVRGQIKNLEENLILRDIIFDDKNYKAIDFEIR